MPGRCRKEDYRVPGHSWLLQSEFEASLSYMRACLKRHWRDSLVQSTWCSLEGQSLVLSIHGRWLKIACSSSAKGPSALFCPPQASAHISSTQTTFPFLSFPFLSFPFLSFPFLSFPFLSFLNKKSFSSFWYWLSLILNIKSWVKTSFLELFPSFTKLIKLTPPPPSFSLSRFCFYEVGLVLFRPALICWLQQSLQVSTSCLLAGPTGTCHHIWLKFAFKSNLIISHESYQNFFFKKSLLNWIFL